MNTKAFELTDAELSAVEGGKTIIMVMVCTVVIRKDAG